MLNVTYKLYYMFIQYELPSDDSLYQPFLNEMKLQF